MAVIVANEERGARGGHAGRTMDYTQSGVLWATVGGFGDDIGYFFYSNDAGATWTESVASRLAVGTSNIIPFCGTQCFFIDKDNFAHLLYLDPAGSFQVVSYRRGTLDPTGTFWTWSSRIDMSVAGGASSVNGAANYGFDLVAHREGTGWKAHCVYGNLLASSQTRVTYCRINITSGGLLSIDTTAEIFNTGANTDTTISIDFRHEQDDPKAVQASTPSLYVSYMHSDVNSILYFNKISYSAGVWSIGSQRSIDGSAQLGVNGAHSGVYDGTRYVMVHVRSGDSTTVRCDERDEADTTTTNRNPTALSLGSIYQANIGYVPKGANADIMLFVANTTDDAYYKIRYDRGGAAWAGAWTLVDNDVISSGFWDQAFTQSMARGMDPTRFPYLPAMWGFQDSSPNEVRTANLVSNYLGDASLTGVASITVDAAINHSADTQLIGVATLTPNSAVRFGGDVLLQGVAKVTATPQTIPFLDFTVFDAYIETADGLEGLLFYDQSQPETVSRRLTPVRQDVGNNPDEIRPEFGDAFAQSDFSHGMGQRYFHHPGRDAKKYWWSEGYDVSEEGKLLHLHPLTPARASTSIGRLEQVGDLVFVANGTNIDRGSGSLPGSWTAEDPSQLDPDQAVNDLAAEGARLFAAINTATAGVRIRDAGGAWTRFQIGGTDLVVGTPYRLAWLKERLIVVGGTNARSIYEVVANATPPAIETLPEGWAFEEIFEAGGFIHACAVNAAAGLSKVHHYGLNDTLSAIEKKSSTAWPQGQLMYTGCGFPGLAFVAGGVRNSQGGYDPILYRAGITDDTGALTYEEIRQEEGSGNIDLSVRSVIPMGEEILVGWSLGSGAYGGYRDGIASYHVPREAFVHHVKKTGVGTAQRITAIMPYKGSALVSINGDGLYFEDTSSFVTTAQLVTSAADWNNAGDKVWDRVQLSHDALPAATSIRAEYTTVSFEANEWTEALTSSNDGDVFAETILANVRSRLFALRLTSTAAGSVAPEFLGYTVRSLSAPVTPEFQLTRYIRLLDEDRKDEDGPMIYKDPREMMRFMQDGIYSFVTFYEAGFTWTAWLEDVSTVEPLQPMYNETSGEPEKDAFVVRLQMTGTR